jgi:predicted Zn-dependent protease
LKITESLVNKALREELYDKAVTNLSQLLEDCVRSVKFINLKIECLMKAYKFEEANTYSAQVMKLSSNLANNPQLLCTRGKVLIYTGADVIGKKHLT